MPSAVRLREDYSAEKLRALARRSKNVNHSLAKFNPEVTMIVRRRAIAFTTARRRP